MRIQLKPIIEKIFCRAEESARHKLLAQSRRSCERAHFALHFVPAKATRSEMEKALLSCKQEAANHFHSMSVGLGSVQATRKFRRNEAKGETQRSALMRKVSSTPNNLGLNKNVNLIVFTLVKEVFC